MFRPACCATFTNLTPTPSSVLVWPDIVLPVTNMQRTIDQIKCDRGPMFKLIITGPERVKQKAILCGPLRISAFSALRLSSTQRPQRYAEGRREHLERHNNGSQQRKTIALLDCCFPGRHHYKGAGWNGQVALKKIRS